MNDISNSVFTASRKINVQYLNDNNEVIEQYAINDAKIAMPTKDTGIHVYFFIYGKEEESSCFDFDPKSQFVEFIGREGGREFKFTKKIPALKKKLKITFPISNEKIDEELLYLYDSLNNVIN